MKVGDRVKLSEEGLRFLYQGRPRFLLEAAKVLRGEVRKIKGEIVTIRRLDTPKHSYSHYHISFLEEEPCGD